MRHLQVGDLVKVDTGVFSHVLRIQPWRGGCVQSEFLRTGTDISHELLLITGHYLYVDGNVLAPARTAVPGEVVRLGNDTFARVKGVARESALSLCHPQSMRIDIVVSGISASTCTTPISQCATHIALRPLRISPERFRWYIVYFENSYHHMGKPSGRFSFVEQLAICTDSEKNANKTDDTLSTSLLPRVFEQKTPIEP